MKLHTRFLGAVLTVLMMTANLSAQWRCGTSWLKVNGGIHSDSLIFGLEPGATYGVDSAFGEFECPPTPPTGGFDARWFDPRVDLLGGTNSFGIGMCGNDVRPCDSSRVDTFEVKFAPDSGYTVTLSWSPSDLRLLCDSIIMHDAILDGGIFTINMLDVDSVHVAGPPPSRNSVSSMFIYWYARGLAQGVREGFGTPGTFSLQQNYPNPFNPATNFQFTIANLQLAILKVYNLLGEEVTTLVEEVKQPGTYRVTWDAAGFPSGVYFYRLTAGTFSETKKLILVK